MAELKKRKLRSLKWTFILYIPICVVISWIGAYFIGNISNYLQEWYQDEVYDIRIEHHEDGFVVIKEPDGTIMYEPYYKPSYEKAELKYEIIYGIISYTQTLLIPLWVFFCVGLTGTAFYKREIEKPLRILMDASEKIANNCLDFQVPKANDDELGDLCQSFEQMRSALYENNQKTWRMLEERKQLNAAFAHDIRTPITVLKGYTDLLQKYEGTETLTTEKKAEILEMMKQQVERLENYAQKMSSVQKLEDIEVHRKTVPIQSIFDKCREMCSFIKLENETIPQINVQVPETCTSNVYLDEELVLEVFENVLVNALRYAREQIIVTGSCDESVMSITVEDDGRGFSEEELINAAKPFYRAKEETEQNHFGLGLYICSVICKKCGGKLEIANGNTNGAKVTAIFLTK